MMFNLRFGDKFCKQLQNLSMPEKRIIYKKLKMLRENPFYPSLRTKKIKGDDGIYEMSVNMDLRILWRYEGNEIILLLAVGHHKDILGV